MISWIASVLTILAIILNGFKNIWCWPIYMVTNILWIVYFIPKLEWAVIVLNLVFFIINILALIKWKKDQQK
jgi:nicotinamide riboside transporter PnuC